MALGTFDHGEPALLSLSLCAARGTSDTGALVSLLDREEQEHAKRFRRPDDRDRYRLGRATLRLVLGDWLDRDPASLRFAAGPHGKPELVGHGPLRLHCKPPQFNLSHSGDLILLAFHADAPVGVDVERLRPDLDWLPIARRCLGPAELESLLALAPAEAAPAFVESWCDLEAGLKARGVGLARASDAKARAMEPRLRRWRLDLPPGYAGAVALLQPA